MNDTTKIIIEIPTAMYQSIQIGEGESFFKIPLWLCHSIVEGKPLSDEIVDIKEEISMSKTEHELQIAERDIKCRTLASDIYCDVVRILDNHLMESDK